MVIFIIEFNAEISERIQKKLEHTKKNAQYFKRMYEDTRSKTYFNLYERMSNCLNYWEWDRYDKNRLLDLQKVNRCMNRYCPNCRSVGLGISIDRFAPQHKKMIENDYIPVLITLTVPNCSGDELKDTIDKMSKSFRNFIDKLSKNDRRGLKDRYINVMGAIRVLEITKNKKNSTYHPHFHVLAYIDSYDEMSFLKQYQGLYRQKSNEYILNSDLDYQIQKLWTFCYYNYDFKKWSEYSDFNFWNNESQEMEYLIADVRIINLAEGGIYEVFKYAFKDTDIDGYDDFKVIYGSLYGRRIRQAYGALYGLKLDCEDEILDLSDEDIINYLEYDKKEKPLSCTTKGLNDSDRLYHDYKKISRHRRIKEIIDFE